MRYYISGGRHDGRDWPQPDVPIEVPDWEGEDLIRGGNAVRVAAPALVSGSPPPPPQSQQLPGQPPRLQPLPGTPPVPETAHLNETAASPAAQATQPEGGASREAAAAAEPAGAPAGNRAGGSPGEPGGPAAEPIVAAATSPPAAPGPSAAKRAWIDYAVAGHKADPAQAEAMTKADLMSRYGGRL
jgi:hypothetical protein